MAEGVRLARIRRAALKELIQLAPEEALKLAVPRSARATLPAEIVAELETLVDGYGRFEVIQVCAIAGGAVLRQAEIEGRRYDLFTYGNRHGARTKNHLAMHGIAIDDKLAVADTPYRRLEDGEAPGESGVPPGLVVAVGHEFKAFNGEAELSEWSRREAAFESVPNPDATGDSNQTAAAVTADWVNGEKTVLWIRVEFSDDAGSPGTDQDIAFSMAAVNQFYADVSRGRTSFKATIIPGLLRLSHAKASFESGTAAFSQLSDEALRLARAYDAANGNTGLYNPDRYDRYVVAFKHVDEFKQEIDNGDGVKPETWAGLAAVGGKGLWLNGVFQYSQFGNYKPHTLAHELGHNQGLFHSHAWIPREGRGPEYFRVGGHCEYGDPFDVMGASTTTVESPVPSGHFNTRQKATLGYLAPAEVQPVSTSGVHRIYRSDHRQASGVQALQIRAGSAYDYWLEYSPAAAALDDGRFSPKYAARCQNGVLLRWGSRPSFASGLGTYLIDATPLQVTRDGWMNDAALGVGEIFRDDEYAIRIAPLATGGTAPNEYIDVEVSLGATTVIREGPRFTSTNLLYDDRTGSTAIAAGTNIVIPVAARGHASVQLWVNGQLVAEKSGDNPSFTWRPRMAGLAMLQLRAIDASGRGFDSIPIPVQVDLTGWEWQAPAGIAHTLTAVHHALGQWWAAGEQGTILNSADGRAWNAVPVPTTATFVSLASDGARLVAAVDYSTDYNSVTNLPNAYWTTTDGRGWTNAFFSILTGQPRAVAFANGAWVLGGNGGKIYTTTDAADPANWSETSSVYSIQSLACGAGRWIGVGYVGAIYTSTDAGRTWTSLASPTTQGLYAVASNGSRWVAVGGGGTIVTSADGVTWVAAPPVVDTWLRGVSVIGGQFVAVGSGGTVLSSSDGLAWTTYPQARYVDLHSIAEHGGTIVAVGQDGEILTGASLSALVPVDDSPRMRAIAGVAAANGKVVIAGTANDLFARQTRTAVMTLFERVGWQAATGASVQSEQTAVAAGRGIYVSSGLAGTLFTSTDGTAWNARRSGLTRKLNGVAIGPATIVAVGDAGSVTTSADGTSWSVGNSGTTQNLRAVGYGNGQFIAVGDNGAVIGSPDGSAWAVCSSGVVSQLNAISWSEGVGFAAVGNSGTIITSRDGVTWTTRILDRADRVNLVAVAATPAGFAVVAGNYLLVSSDGVAWTRAWSGMNSATAITYGDGALWIAGSNGRIMKHAFGDPGRLINLSILTALATAGDSFTVGTVIGGAGTVGTKALVIRAVGPSLVPLGVGAALVDPALELFSAGRAVAANNDWGGEPALSGAFGRVGAFAYASAGSKDAAIAPTALPAGGYTVQVSGVAGATGTVLAEIYDATAADDFEAATPRLINVSVLKQVNAGGVLTGGFVVGGANSRPVLIRAIGPSLGTAPFNVSGAMADPRIEVFSGQTSIAGNDNWALPMGAGAATGAQLARAFAQVGAFSVAGESKDAAVLVTLAPGSYTAQVSSANTLGGLVLVEIYEVP